VTADETLGLRRTCVRKERIERQAALQVSWCNALRTLAGLFPER
jgi:hypothetical protein